MHSYFVPQLTVRFGHRFLRCVDHRSLQPRPLAALTASRHGSAMSLLYAPPAPERSARRSSRGAWVSSAVRSRGEGTTARRAWRAAYVRQVFFGDFICAALAGLAGYAVRFGT